MICVDNELVKAILIDNKFIDSIELDSNKIFTHYLGRLKLDFIENYTLEELDSIYIGGLNRLFSYYLGNKSLRYVDNYILEDIDELYIGEQ